MHAIWVSVDVIVDVGRLGEYKRIFDPRNETFADDADADADLSRYRE